jgi:hypothetical protein
VNPNALSKKTWKKDGIENEDEDEEATLKN